MCVSFCRAYKEEDERIRLSGEWIERITKEKGFCAQFQEFIAKA